MALYSDPEEQFRAIRANDEKALQVFYQQNYPKLEKYVLANSGSAEEAKDIFQEAFIAMWRNIQLGKFELKQSGSLEGYIYRIACNKWLDHLRSVKHQPVIPLTEDMNRADEQTGITPEQEQQLDGIKENFLHLGQPCREVLERFYYHKESLRSIAERMQWTEATAKNNKYRCLQRLRELFKQQKRS